MVVMMNDGSGDIQKLPKWFSNIKTPIVFYTLAQEKI
jgi:hypothetical protein